MNNQYFYKNLIGWYIKVQRQLPWRESFEPYTVWLSEIMLQQTQVITVIDYFNRFVKAYPTVEALSQANEDDVFKLWEGLGYYSRARNLIRCAKIVVEEYEGQFPNDYKTLLKLPGIGPYTAGAILSIAYNQSIPAVDGNVMRVISRYRGLDVNISDTKSRVVFEKEVMSLIGGSPRDFNQGIMELGATVCTPKQSKCEQCPVNEGCQAFKSNTVDQYPVKLKKIKKKTMNMAAIILEEQDKMMIVKRPNSGLMANLWGFPVVETTSSTPEREIEDYIHEAYGLEIDVLKIEEGARHIFTHLIWDMTLYRCVIKASNKGSKIIEYPENLWVGKEAFNEYAFPTAFRKLFPLI
ncbi:A/G-specific DNA-adenine glycosylase [Natranaerovirga pectinivora]|uniref:Adenine DNA glycosylase n=1 Tax=Natranaerovirga pectinivora TaxID=682400 RepID=A0A4R3MS38_9FIRM|nr:A/G-specific adenine glycosylase [Natranaerovirga pectinivora]TCT16238.1 A/G-specific DNA-adenine glycosylase [Natranaerovirga pectinivora]